jgi:hypothetical protein
MQMPMTPPKKRGRPSTGRVRAEIWISRQHLDWLNTRTARLVTRGQLLERLIDLHRHHFPGPPPQSPP